MRILAAVLAFLIVYPPLAAAELTFDELIHYFEQDMDRRDPLKMVERYKTIVADLSGMKITQPVDIVVSPRGDVKQSFFKEDMKKLRKSGKKGIAGYEFILKRFGLLAPENNLIDILFNRYYDEVYGFYRPLDKKLIVMEGLNRQLASATLFHELIHAAQDAAVDLVQFQSKYGQTLDSAMAAHALIEGQAVFLDMLLRVEQNRGGKITDELLQKIMDEMGSDVMEEGNFFDANRLFPYVYGLQFVLQRYFHDKLRDPVKMLKKVPLSTEQILHPDKFADREKPVITPLARNRRNFSSAMGLENLYHTTMGEYIIGKILSSKLETEEMKEAAAGWGGDYIMINRRNNKSFLVWDTRWDTGNDAREFAGAYKQFVRKRFDAKKMSHKGAFDVVFPETAPRIALKQQGKRVAIIEGDIPFSVFVQAAKELQLEK